MNSQNKPAGTLLRRLAANVYDAVILISLWIAATFLLLPLSHGQAISSGNLFYQLYLLGIALLYYVGSWHAFQQTIGMRAWGLILVDIHHQRAPLICLFMRFVSAIPSYGLAACGLWWSLFDNKKRALHDVLSKTQLIYRSKIISE